jgi:hypothetical protein
MQRTGPLPKRVASQVTTQLGLDPLPSSIDGGFDSGDPATGIERDPLHGRMHARLDDTMLRKTGHERAHPQLRDGHRLVGLSAGRHAPACVVGHPVGRRHEQGIVANEIVVDHLDFRQVLHPVGTEIPWNDQLQRVAVENRQRLAVHRPGEQYIRTQRVLDVESLDEVRRRRQYGSIETVESHLPRACLDTGFLQNGLQRNTDPARIAHGTVTQLRAKNTWNGESAAVAGTLIDGDEFARRGNALQFRQGQR